MNATRRALGLCLIVLLTASCSSTQSRYVMLGRPYAPRPEGYDVQVFRDGPPQRPFVRISRLDVHVEKTYFMRPSFEDAVAELKEQARLSGADAIIDVQERSSTLNETGIYHVTATGIRYTDSP
jgi:hypothetical protein